MKKLFFAMALILSINISAQKGTEKANVFVRVYDLQGKKISKGNILTITDSMLQLNAGTGPKEIEVSNIGLIKTKRSAGNNILIGSVIGAVPLIILAAVSTEGNSYLVGHSVWVGAARGSAIGVPVGALIGGITSLFKNSKSYIIDGDDLKWKEFKETITGLKQE